MAGRSATATSTNRRNNRDTAGVPGLQNRRWPALGLKRVPGHKRAPGPVRVKMTSDALYVTPLVATASVRHAVGRPFQTDLCHFPPLSRSIRRGGALAFVAERFRVERSQRADARTSDFSLRNRSYDVVTDANNSVTNATHLGLVQGWWRCHRIHRFYCLCCRWLKRHNLTLQRDSIRGTLLRERAG